MKSLILSTIVLFSGLASAKQIKIKLDIPSNIVNIQNLNGGGGTGFYIKSNLVVSAKHVCDISNLRLYNRDKIISINKDPYTDLCLIQTKGLKGVKPLTLAGGASLNGGVCSYGFSSEGYTMLCGKVIGFIRANIGKNSRDWDYVFSIKIIPGMSGGPLLNKNNRVIGVNSWVHLGSDISAAVSVRELKRFIKQTGL